MLIQLIMIEKIVIISMVWLMTGSVGSVIEAFDDNKILLQGNFSDDVYTIEMSFANRTVDILGHALVSDVKGCLCLMHTFAPHCVKAVQFKWPEADHGIQRIPEFSYIPVQNSYFSYYFDFGEGGPLFEAKKCCIIYELLDCIHSQYKEKCGIGFAPIDELIHLFAIEIENNCGGVYINNLLYNLTYLNLKRYHPQERDQQKNCYQFLPPVLRESSDNPELKSSIALISLLITFVLEFV